MLDWIHLAHRWVQLQAFVNAVMNVRVLKNDGKFVTVPTTGL